ncbi:MAG: GNAT family N-acetyltransferase [Egibacteraceae bacterium]
MSVRSGQPWPPATDTPSFTIRRADPHDLAAIVSIYNQAVDDRNSTCDLSGFTPEQRQDWFQRHTDPFGIWVAQAPSNVIGWVSLSPFVDKLCFNRTAMSATYVDRAHRGRGVGKKLRHYLIVRAREHGFHSVVARLWSTNEASIHLSEQLGYQLAGRLKEAVWVDGEMLDVLFYQKVLDDGPRPDRPCR